MASNIKQKLAILSVTTIGVDEFNLQNSFFTLKASLFFAGILLVLAALENFSLISKRKHGHYLIVSQLLLLLALFQVLSQVSNEYFFRYSVTQFFLFVILIFWADTLSYTLNEFYIKISFILLFFICTVKFTYEAYMYVFHNFAYDWLPSGFPRFLIGGGGMTSNQTGAIWLSIFLVLSTLTFHSKIISKKQYYTLYFPITLLGGFMSGSRSFLFGVIIYFGVLKFLRRNYFSMLIILLAPPLLFFSSDLLRLNDESTLSRIEMWQHSLNLINQNLLFGVGVGANPAPHNTPLQIISEYGTLGCIVIGALIYQLFFSGFKGSLSVFLLTFLPYTFFLFVDIGFLQWQTWALLSSSIVLAKNKI